MHWGVLNEEDGVTRWSGYPLTAGSTPLDLVDANVELECPVAAPPVIYCIGLNYRHHAEETGAKIPKFPIVFTKSPTALLRPGGEIKIPSCAGSTKVDYECELAVVIGKRSKNISKEQALDSVAGYCCANDVSARDWQLEWGGSQWVRGKSFDTFCPLGPWLVTPDTIPDPQNLTIRTRLNGKLVQDWRTNDMIFSVAEVIAFLSQSTTLLPGTIILTGTPHGVGMARKPPLWLTTGDDVAVEIEGLGVLQNEVALERTERAGESA